MTSIMLIVAWDFRPPEFVVGVSDQLGADTADADHG